MGYRTLLDRNLTRAFNLIKDLAVDVTLIKISKSEFDFGSQSATTTEESVITKAVWIEVDEQIMLKSATVGDINMYSGVSYQGKLWKIVEILKNDGYIVILKVEI